MLFNPKMVATAPIVAVNENQSGALSTNTQHLAPQCAVLEDVLSQVVKEGQTIHWVSDGGWSMHHLLRGLLDRVGKAQEVWISSYAFSEEPARTIAALKADGSIQKLHCLIDSRIDVRSASALAMLRNCSNTLKLTHTHAKVTIIYGQRLPVVVVSSANYTTNKRYEAGLICTDWPVIEFHRKWMKYEFANI